MIKGGKIEKCLPFFISVYIIFLSALDGSMEIVVIKDVFESPGAALYTGKYGNIMILKLVDKFSGLLHFVRQETPG